MSGPYTAAGNAEICRAADHQWKTCAKCRHNEKIQKYLQVGLVCIKIEVYQSDIFYHTVHLFCI